MPPRGPRSLFFQTEYFRDHEFQTQLNADEREAYLGIAQLADDEGWLEWIPEQVAYHLFMFRETPLKVLDSVVEALKRTQRIRIYACGHAQLLRWGSKRRHVGRHLAPDGSVAEAHRAHGKRSGNVPATKKKLGGPPAETSGNSGDSSHLHSLITSHPARPPAPARGGGPRTAGDLLRAAGLKEEIANGTSGKSRKSLPSED